MNELVTYQGGLPDIRHQCARRKDRQPCFICGMHRDITEAHHILPIKEVKRLLVGWGHLPEPPTVWLCPNHHTLIHSAERGALDPSKREEMEALQFYFLFQQQSYEWLRDVMRRRAHE